MGWIVSGSGSTYSEAETEAEAIAEVKKMQVGVFAYGLQATPYQCPCSCKEDKK
ncbi:MAG: hypothetical protein PHX05_07310 [Acidobacteriota bacterium]|nr:hypothetical protein [Acidobacteriota bacterium]